MSYLVIARKWRPTTFSEVVGQEHVTTTLENAIKNDRLASAYIFSGPRGVGKTTTARILTKALNCENGPTPTPCNTCAACTEITAGNSIDVLEIDGASNRGIDEVRNLRESTRYTPARNRYKIYIIDEVHMLTTEAFNALLKTLEEPPAHVVFIFATTEVNKLPATILSRCQRFDFRRISAQKIVAQLEKICSHEKITIDKSALYLIARKSEGCMRDSQSLLDQVISFCGTTIQEDDVANLLGAVGQDVYFEITRAIAEHDLPSAVSIARHVYEKGYEIKELISGLAEHFNLMLTLKTTGSKEHFVGLEPFIEEFEKHAGRFSETDLIRMMQVIIEAAADVRWSMNPHLHLEMLLLRLAKMPASVELQQVLDDIEELKKKRVVEPAEPQTNNVRVLPQFTPRSQTTSLFQNLSRQNAVRDQDEPGPANATSGDETASGSEPVDLEVIRSKWAGVVAAVKKKKISLGSMLAVGQPYHLSGNQLEILFGEKDTFHVNTLNENQKLIQEAILSETNMKVFVHCLKGTNANGHSPAGKHPAAENTAPAAENVAAADEPAPQPQPEHTAETVREPTPIQTQTPPAETVPDTGDWLSAYPLAGQIIETLGGEKLR